MEVVTVIKTEGAHRARGKVCQGLKTWVFAVDPQRALGREHGDKASKDGLDGVQIGVDVGVVVFQVVDGRSKGSVMPEFGDLVEVSGVVLVAFDDEGVAITQAVVGAEVAGDPSQHKPRVFAGVGEDPGQHGSRGGLAMGAGDHQGALVADDEVAKGLRKAQVGKSTAAHLHGVGVAFTTYIADDDEVGLPVQVGGIVTHHNVDISILEPGAHGRVGVGVGATHRKALLGEHGRQAPHGAATNADDMNGLDGLRERGEGARIGSGHGLNPRGVEGGRWRMARGRAPDIISRRESAEGPGDRRAAQDPGEGPGRGPSRRPLRRPERPGKSRRPSRGG